MTEKSQQNKENGLSSTNTSTQFTSISQILKKYKSQDKYSISPKKFHNPNKKNAKETHTGDNSVTTPVKFKASANKDNAKNNTKQNVIALHAMTSNKKSPPLQRNQLNSPDFKEEQINKLDHSASQSNKAKKPLHTSLDKIMSDGSFQELDTEGNMNSYDDDDLNNVLLSEANKNSSTSSINEKSNHLDSKITNRIPQISINPFIIQDMPTSQKLETSPNESVKKTSSDHIHRQFLLAAKKGDKETFLNCLEKILALPNGDINYSDESKFTALHYACEEGNLKIVDILIKANCDINARNNNIKTPLHLAAYHGYFDISKLLIENGSNMNQVDNEKNTPLHLCTLGGHVELLKYFLDKLPQADQKNIYGKTPINLATKTEIKELFNDYLIKNENKFHKVKIHTTTDQNLNKMFRHLNNRICNTGQKPISNRQGMYPTDNSTSPNTHTHTNPNNNISNQNNININIQANISSNNNTNRVISSKKTKAPNKLNVVVKTNIDNKQYKVDNVPKTTSNRLTNQTANSLTKKYSINNFNLNSPTHKDKGHTPNNNNNTSTSNNKSLKKNNYDFKVGKNDNLKKTKTLAAFSGQRKNTILNDNPQVGVNQFDLKSEDQQFNINVSTDNYLLNKTEDDYSKKKNGMIIDTEETENQYSQMNLNSIEEEKITPSSFVCLALLGRGSFGEVYLVEKVNSSSLYAMKVLSKDRISSQNLLKYAMAERNVLSLTNHPFIVKLNYAFQTINKLFLILDYCENGDLSKHLYVEKRFTEDRAKFYLCEIILALEDIHKRDVIFRDLKPDNVVLDEDGHARLTDFGLSKEGVYDSNCAKSFCGSIAYLAPEMLKRRGHGKAVDWYLLGVLFYEMLVGIPPFFTNQKEEIFRNIEHAELQIPRFISKDASDLLRMLLQKDPNKRLGGGERDAEEIKENKYFNNIDWNSIYEKKIPPPKFRKCNKPLQIYAKPRMFQTDEDTYLHDGYLNGWSFINNDENNY